MAELAGLALGLMVLWVFFPLVARFGGALLAVVGLVGATSHETWAGWMIAVGLGLWLAGSWLHAVKTSRYSSSLARFLFEHTPLKWTLWQHWRAAMHAPTKAPQPPHEDPHPYELHHYR